MPALAASPWKQGRQVIWNALKRAYYAGETTTIRAISRATSIDPRTVRSYVHGLVAAGVVDELRMEVRGHPSNFILSGINVNSEAPCVRVDGSPAKAEGTGRDRMWRTMKMLKLFTARDLAVAASVDGEPIAEAEAIRYTEWLGRAGYTHALRAGPRP